MKVALVSVPWAALDMPPLGLGILANVAREVSGVEEVHVINSNLSWAEYVVTNAPELTPSFLDEFGRETYGAGYSDWIFSSSLHGVESWNREQYLAYIRGRYSSNFIDAADLMHRIAPSFIEALGERLIKDGYDVVGCTSTFQQTAASVALFNYLKSHAPKVVTVLGGANCDGEQGRALHLAYPSIDFVVRGEGERAFSALLAGLQMGGHPSISGLCWRDESGVSIQEPMSSSTIPPNEYVLPDYDEYFAHVGSSEVLSSYVSPYLVVEGSRGCWWGEKHHCTFCGLNGSFMKFRSKDGARFAQEVLELVERYKTLNVYVVDNILDMHYFADFVPVLAASGYDLAIMCEVKSNLKAEQLEQLAAAGVRMIQPGIENLHSEPLRLMKKGVTGLQNIKLLRDAQEHDMTVAWNYLYGFPQERWQDYQSVLTQLPALYHLQPPGDASRISIERFSPLFNEPARGFADKRPAAHYKLIFDLPDDLLYDMAYHFDVTSAGISDAEAKDLSAAISEWNEAHVGSQLSWFSNSEEVVLRNTRDGFAWETVVIEQPWQRDLFFSLQAPHRSQSALDALLQAEHDVSIEEVCATLSEWSRLGIVVEQEERYLSVAVRAMNSEWLRLGISAESVG